MEEQQKSIDELALELSGGLTAEELREKMNNLSVGSSVKQLTVQESIELQQFRTDYWQTCIGRYNRPSVPVVRTFKPETIVQNDTVTPLSYAAARMLLWQILVERAEVIRQHTANPAFDWVFSKSDAANIQNLLKWLINDPTGTLPLNKGLFVYGLPGTGKTEIIRALCTMSGRYCFNKSLAFSRMSEVYTKAKSDINYNPIDDCVRYDRVLDEAGRYTGEVTRYGDKLDINEAVIEQRYCRWSDYGQVTILISNGNRASIKGLFSEMLYSRILEFTTPVFFDGPGHRAKV